MNKRILYGVVVFLVGTFFISPPAEAGGYLDPNTGGLVFQLLAASFAFLSGLILIFARRIRMTIARVRRTMRDRIGNGPDSGSVGHDEDIR